MNEELKLAKVACKKAFEEYTKANQNYINAMSDCERQVKKEELKIAIENFEKAFKKYGNLQQQNL